MKPINALFVIMAITIVLASAAIANCKFANWSNYQINKMSKGYLDLLEDNDYNLGINGQKNLIREAYNESKTRS